MNKEIQNVSPFKKLCITVGNLPTAYIESMSYYECITFLVNYLTREVVPTVNNNSEVVKELQSYVEHYFDNLDVQEEINNKLDEMAKDGSLTLLIKNYVDPYINAQNQTIANFENEVDTTLSNFNNKINKLYNYSPIAVSSTSKMTDTTRIYVLTTNGHWYYYDNSEWQDGGVYQASAEDELLNNTSTNAVQNKVITNAISNVLDITNTESNITETYTPTWTDGYIDRGGTAHESTTYKHTNKINVNEGDIIGYIDQKNLNGYIRFLCAYDENDNPISASGSDTALTTYTVPAGVSSIVISNAYNDDPIILVTKSKTGIVQTVKYKKEINNTISKSNAISYTTQSGFINAIGQITPNDNFVVTNSISVNSGDKIIISSNQYKTSGARVICAYIGEIACAYKGIVSNASNVKEYIVPKYVTSIKLCLPVGHNWSITKISYYNSKLNINNNLGGYKYIGEIAQNEVIKFDYNNIKPSYNINFSSHISSLDSIEIGYTNEDTFTRLLQVTDTNLIVYASDNNYLTIPHGLTISNDIGISLMVHPYNKDGYDVASVKLFSNGEEYNTTAPNIYTFGYNINGEITLKVNNSVVSNCSFSLGIENIDKPIWIFGDSWISKYETRWPYYLVQNDFNNNCFMNGYPGENSINGLLALQKLIKIRAPKYLLWLYGMNDADNKTSVNSNWLTSLNSVIDICKENNIELILATIPTTPTQLNYYKNEIVKNSGYRYFDQENAVTINNTWISGYASPDGNHTSIAGAKALYYKLLTDVPEITNF